MPAHCIDTDRAATHILYAAALEQKSGIMFVRHTRIQYIHAILSCGTLLYCLHTPFLRYEEPRGHAYTIAFHRNIAPCDCFLPCGSQAGICLPQLTAAVLKSHVRLSYDASVDSTPLGFVLFVYFASTSSYRQISGITNQRQSYHIISYGLPGDVVAQVCF